VKVLFESSLFFIPVCRGGFHIRPFFIRPESKLATCNKKKLSLSRQMFFVLMIFSSALKALIPVAGPVPMVSRRARNCARQDPSHCATRYFVILVFRLSFALIFFIW
jgi:hypothetical protein